MNQILPIGGNTVLSSASGEIVVRYQQSNTVDVSLTAFLLTDEGKVQGDNGIIFYNQPQSETGIATLLPTTTSGSEVVHTLRFDLAKAPVGISKIAITLTEDNMTGFTNVNNLVAHIRTGQDVLQLTPLGFQQENGIIVAELYIRNAQVKAKSIWRGFNSGLKGLCENYGVEVEEASQPVIEKPKEPVVKLEKVTGAVDLKKGQRSVIIEKTPVITATVSWKSGTDYDIYALVYTKNGEQIDVAMFGAEGVARCRAIKEQLSIWGMLVVIAVL